MKTLDAASERRATELEGLRRLAPDVSGKPSQDSPIGDAIDAVAKELGTDEMKDREGPFDVRFILLQAQATRMITAISIATARFEPNRQRKQWLLSTAAEYEGYRNDMIALVEKRFGPKKKTR